MGLLLLLVGLFFLLLLNLLASLACCGAGALCRGAALQRPGRRQRELGSGGDVGFPISL